MKLIKIRFTSWHESPRALAIQQKLADWAMRTQQLALAATRIKEELMQSHTDSGILKKSLARIVAEQQKIEDERALLLTAEANLAKVSARQHEKVGTFGYQVLDDSGTRVEYFVDEAGHALPPQVAYTYDVVNDGSPIPEWAKKGKASKAGPEDPD